MKIKIRKSALAVMVTAIFMMAGLAPGSVMGEDSEGNRKNIEEEYRIEKKEMQERHQQERKELEERYNIQKKEMKGVRKDERKTYRDDRPQRRDDDRGYSGTGRDDRGPDDSGRRGR
ncbi:hypothetical protein SAMN05660860_01940 [Geoalkalibacter ferrihydriticus]|uniref:Uncharacterized protein n=2 Tax=Geoalkalibacter ferrihydriticus TaxID=392333 RepID=A0A0C2DVG1_9BACT|nr:hypothetical protein [Geoalkalibacter ferrihydriticus]KIH77424.1 hypothetical protein GFER_01435 [Geoalkalibacter ferrihydriticus DSM 17813]SDM15515.1 hypothetical protein SAMN05660860_01940 [Geoalkalibacter ferrihydriticus]